MSSRGARFLGGEEPRRRPKPRVFSEAINHTLGAHPHIPPLPETQPQGRLLVRRFEIKETPLQLKLATRNEDGVLVVDCVGRIVFGDESGYLRDTVKQLIQENKRIVLNLGEITYIDSGGLGT